MPPVIPPTALRQLGRMTSDTGNQLAQFASRQGLEAKEGPPGAQGPVGPPGAGMFYEHVQGSASATWTVVHKLKIFPGFQAFDSEGREQVGRIEHVSNEELKVYFLAAFAGKGYCN